jgi:hypothetical protein
LRKGDEKRKIARNKKRELKRYQRRDGRRKQGDASISKEFCASANHTRAEQALD